MVSDLILMHLDGVSLKINHTTAKVVVGTIPRLVVVVIVVWVVDRSLQAMQWYGRV